MRELLTAGDVAHLASDVTPDTVRAWERAGKLPAAAKTPGGVRLFERAAVVLFLEQREEARSTR